MHTIRWSQRIAGLVGLSFLWLGENDKSLKALKRVCVSVKECVSRCSLGCHSLSFPLEEAALLLLLNRGKGEKKGINRNNQE